jgi:NAD(P)-dependent dehydrogenase (short-subunit alcohol dehydrogenase family)
LVSHDNERVCLITGASAGIGLATAVGLARLGGRVVLVCRDAGRGATAVDRVRRGGAPGANVDLVVADLSSQRSVRRLASEICDGYPRLDAVIQNAGVVALQRRVTEDRIELQLAVNHLAPFLLTQLLRGPLAASGAGRVVIVASQVERDGTIRFDDLQGERHYDALEAYSQSKLGNVLFTYALAERWAGTGITVNCLHPGIVRSQLLENMWAAETKPAPSPSPLIGGAAGDLLRGGLRRGLGAIRSRIPGFAPRRPEGSGPLTPEEGAKTSIFVATAPELAGVSGRYFRELAEARSSPQSYDTAVRERLWSVSADLVGLAAG